MQPVATDSVADALRVTLVQSHTHWHDAEANRDMFSEQLAGLEGATDLVLLPEMWSTGFTMASAAVAEDMAGPSVCWMQAQARALDCVVAGSLVIAEEEHRFNRFVAAFPHGDLVTYDKRHLFRMANEHQHYQAGGRRQVFSIAGWRICPMVCYDLRFPVWFRNQGDYDLLICVANWPAARRTAWNTLLRARAIENQAYVAAVNIVGVDGNEVAYSGGSAAYSPDGEIIAELFERAAVTTLQLQAAPLLELRKKFPVWQDADQYRLDS